MFIYYMSTNISIALNCFFYSKSLSFKCREIASFMWSTSPRCFFMLCLTTFLGKSILTSQGYQLGDSKIFREIDLDFPRKSIWTSQDFQANRFEIFRLFDFRFWVKSISIWLGYNHIIRWLRNWHKSINFKPSFEKHSYCV